MTILTLDDEKKGLSVLTDAVKKVSPDSDIYPFNDYDLALEFINNNKIDVAFLDINLNGYSGIDVAYHIKKTNPKVNIIFATGYSEFKTEAFDMRASGYLMKPITPDQVKEEMDNLRYDITNDHKNEVFVRTFGNFDVLVNGEAIRFSRSLSKEVLAYLVDRAGAIVTRNELAELLFGDEDYSRKTQDYLSKIIKDLQNSLKEAKCQDILNKGRNAYSVNKDKFICDSYLYLKGDPKAINSFDGAYMQQYVWGEDEIDKFYK